MDRHSAEVHIGATATPEPLSEISRLLAYRQLIVPADAMSDAAMTLLRCTDPRRALPGELVKEISSTLVGRGSLRELWLLRGLMSVSKKVRTSAVNKRSTLHSKRFETGKGRPAEPVQPDLDAFKHFWRLRLSGIELRGNDAKLLRNWIPDSAARPELSPEDPGFRRELMKVGKQLTSEHLALVRRWIGEGRDDAATVALNAVRQVVMMIGFEHSKEADALHQRLTLGAVRYERRNACGYLARSVFWIMASLLVAEGVLDTAMRRLFDPDRVFGFGAPLSFDEAREWRGPAFYGMLGTILALYLLMRFADQQVDAVTRRLGLPQL